MFGLDIYSLEVLLPSVVGVLAIASVMTWGCVRVCHLVKQDSHR